MILQNTNSRFNLFRIESFDSRVCYLGEPRKKSVDCRSKEQRRAFSELSFEMGLMLFKVLQFWSDCTGPLIAGDYSTPPVTCMKFSLYLSFQVFSMCIEIYVYIMLSLASFVPISSHINNSPLRSTYGDMSLLYSLTFISKLLPYVYGCGRWSSARGHHFCSAMNVFIDVNNISQRVHVNIQR